MTETARPLARTRFEDDASAARHFAAIFESSEDAILSKDAQGIITSWNAAAERLYGWTAEEAVGQSIRLIIPRERANEEKVILSKVLAGERLTHYETTRVAKDGRVLQIELTVSPVRGERDEIVGASVIARNIEARREAEERADRLLRITNALSRELTRERVLEALLHEARAALRADAATVGVLAADARIVELAGSTGYAEADLSAWKRVPLDAEVPMAEAIRTGVPVFCSTAEELLARYPALANGEVRFAALAVVPLLVEDQPLGALALSFEMPHEFPDTQRSFLLAAAQQAANTLERTRLYESERAGRERLALIANASEVLSGSLDPDETLSRLARLAVPGVADWCAVDVPGSGDGPRNVAVAHADPERVELARRLRRTYPPAPEAELGVARVIATGEPLLVERIPDEMLAAAARDEEHLRLMRELGLSSAIIVPLRARNRTLGALSLVHAESGRLYGPDDVAFAQDLARRAALAVDNAMLYHAEHEAALTLQRALLPAELPSVEGVDLAARYLPAGEGVEVGGDWFDVIVLDDSRLALVVGDVAGSGIRAASVMGQLRTGLRAYILEGHPPDEAIERVDRLMHDTGKPEMATIVQATVDLRRRTIEYARAGHLPAMVRAADGTVKELYGEGSRPVGLFAEPRCHAAAEPLPEGSLLLMYTDGLVERRDSGLMDGLARLRRSLAAAPEDPGACVDAIVDELVGGTPEDDVAVLAMRA